jgi:hypothetical protein
MPVDRLVVDDVPRGTSTFVNGYFPRQRGRVVLLGIPGAVVLTAASSVEAIHPGGAGGFGTAHLAALGAVGPLLGRATGRWAPLRHTLRPLARLSIGLVGVCAAYGASVALAGAPGGFPAAALAALIGLALCYLGLAALGVVRDPFAGWTRHFPDAPMVVVGALVGALQVAVAPAPPGVAGSGNPLYGAAALAARSAGTLVVVAAVFLALSYAAGGRLRRWLADGPRRTTVVVAAGLIGAGALTILHWGGQPLTPGLLIP